MALLFLFKAFVGYRFIYLLLVILPIHKRSALGSF